MNPLQLIIALVAALRKALSTDRSNTEEVARLKAENAALLEKIRAEIAEDADDAAAAEALAQLQPEVEAVLAEALAARPPLPAQIESVNNVEPANPEQQPAPPTEQPAPVPPGNDPAPANTGEGGAPADDAPPNP